METAEREAYLGFKPQKELLYNKFLPYADNLDKESQELLVAIKSHLGRAVMLREINPGVTYWTWQLVKYIQLYGRKFSKSDHIAFIKLAYELITIPELEMDVIQQLGHLLSLLLKKKELLSRDDLQLHWRPLYELYERILYSPYEHMEMLLLPTTIEPTLKSLIRSCRVYFPADSTKEMLEEWRSLLCPFDIAMNKGMAYFDLFLPTRLPPLEHDKGFRLWFDEFMAIWSSSHNSPSWENNMVWLFARLAASNIGYINWDKYMPAIFTRLLRSLNLPSGFSGVHVQQGNCIYETNAIVIWIIAMLGGGSRCQEHIDHLFKMLESYYHPSNNGKWIIKLQKILSTLPAVLVKRIHDEKFKHSTWQTPTPDSHKLTDQDVTKLVLSMKNVVFLAIFSKGGSSDSAAALKNLSLLRPEMMIPPLLDRLYNALETLTEPHRLTATMYCMVSVSRSLVKGGKYFPEGPSHILPLLISSLPGIDPNDIKKCMVTFQFISTFTTLVPLIDCSQAVNYRNDLTPLEHDLCLATSQFEDFVLQFMDRCFILIENSSLENTSRLDRETERMNAEESILGVALSSTFTSILSQSSPEIFKAAVRKLSVFISNHILEIKVSGKLAANMCRSASRVDAKSSLHSFLPHTSRLVLSLTDSDDVLKEEKLDDELLFNLLVLSEIVRCDGKEVLEYADTIKKVLHRTLQLASKQGYLLAGAFLRHTLRALTMTYALEFRSVPRSYSLGENETFNDYLPIRDWGTPGNIDTLKIKWHIPSEEELTFAVDILEEFMKPELEKLESFSAGKQTLSREELLHSLTITLDCILGAGEALPLWSEENIDIIDSEIPLHFMRVREMSFAGINFRDGSNVREVCSNVISEVMEKILQDLEDDTKSLFVIVRIHQALMFHWGVAREDFDKRWKGFHVVKKALEDKISGVKKHIRGLLVDRAVLQHESRLQEKSKCPFTPLHLKMTTNLLKLSISHYSQVRIRAQSVVQLCLQNFPFSYRIFVPDIVKSLAKDPKENHEEFKGSLYFLLGQKQNTVMTVNDWEVINQVWPALVASLPSEKPSIIRLLDHITESIKKYLETMQINLEVPDRVVEQGKIFWASGKPLPSKAMPSNEDITKGITTLKKVSKENEDYFTNTIEKILDLTQSGSLHWRHYNLSTVMMGLLIRHDIPSSTRTVRFYVRNLIHETLAIRKISISVFAAILKQQKKPHPKSDLNLENLPNSSSVSSTLEKYVHVGKTPARSSIRKTSNLWMQYNSSGFPDTIEKWRELPFVHKTHIGFYDWPKPFLVYETDDKQPNLDRQLEDLSDVEVPIYEAFTDPQFIKSFIKYLSLEERKGHDKFNPNRFYFFKGLFRNFGDTFLPFFLPNLKELASDIQESRQRCAAEILAGLLRGSKHWPFEKMMKLKEELTPILSVAFEKITPETVGDWGTCIATASESRDPNKYYWLFELLMENPIRGEGGSFLESSRLYLLLGVLAQQEWRIFELLHRLLEYLEPHMTHGFQNVRDKLGSILCNIFLYDINIPAAADCLQLSPKRSEFILRIGEKMKPLKMENNVTNDKLDKEENHLINQEFMSKERKEAVNLFKTVCKWLMSSIPRTIHSVPKDIYSFLPLLCTLKSDTTDDELQLDCMYTLAILGHAMIMPDSTQVAINTVKDITAKSSWHARSSALSFLQLMVFSNMFNIMNNDAWVAEIATLVLNLLDDEQLEVRECAAECLGGLLHNEFMKVNGELLDRFKKSCNIKLRKKKQPVNSGAKVVDPGDLIKRHGGVLGLCACVNAYPYDVPDFLPEILVILGDHLNDPQPIPTTVKKTLSNFRRTHHDNWRDHKLKFTDDQLVVITDLLVSPSYYA